MCSRKERLERFRAVLGLSAAGMTYEEMTRYIGVNSRQHVQQLVVSAVAKLPQLAEHLGVMGRRNPGRRPKDDQVDEGRAADGIEPQRAPRPSVRAQHIATAKQLLNQHDGHYPRATEMLRCGHGSLYQYMRKYPDAFERLIRERRTGSGQVRRRRKYRRY